MKIEKNHFAKYSIEVDDNWRPSAEGDFVTICIEEHGVFDYLAQIELAPEDIDKLIDHLTMLLDKPFKL